MASEYVRMTDTERVNMFREEAQKKVNERIADEERRRKEIANNTKEISDLKQNLAFQNEAREKGDEILKLRQHLAQMKEDQAKTLAEAQRQQQLDEKQREIDELRQQIESQKLAQLREAKAFEESQRQQQLEERDREINQLRQQIENQKKTEVTPMKQSDYPSATAGDYDTLKKTVYGHAVLEPRETQMAVAFVVLNRAKANQEYWGGRSITAVCKKPWQFWCWNDGKEVQINDWNMFSSIDDWLPKVLDGSIPDNTNGSDHLLPQWEDQPWLSNVDRRATHGNFHFYKSKWLS